MVVFVILKNIFKAATKSSMFLRICEESLSVTHGQLQSLSLCIFKEFSKSVHFSSSKGTNSNAARIDSVLFYTCDKNGFKVFNYV